MFQLCKWTEFTQFSLPEVLFCTSALANPQWLGFLPPLRTPFLAPYALQGWIMVSTQHTCYWPRTDLALI
ncbi:hypothetical protein MVEN_01168800 [Mycena venus]|uniref:Uncharacterized protein n=1 Tax=Mycena venus TaxID=2733690 RepID=A0A8H7CXY4_9AGAR|nr:hypothetical protein MVEN_01168800 [Mycena venus]